MGLALQSSLRDTGGEEATVHQIFLQCKGSTSQQREPEGPLQLNLVIIHMSGDDDASIKRVGKLLAYASSASEARVMAHL